MDTRVLADSTVRIDLGVAGLPEEARGLYLGGLYALKAGTSSARYPLLVGSVLDAVQRGIPCTFVLRGQPEVFIARMEESGRMDLAALAADHRVHFLLMQGEFQKKAFRSGMPVMLEELQYHGVPEDSLVLFDNADDMLAVDDQEAISSQVDDIGAWCRARRVACLMVFTHLEASTSAAINSVMDTLTGVASIDAEREGLALNFEYWRSPEGALLARQFRLTSRASGLYEAAPWTQMDPGLLQTLLAASRLIPQAAPVGAGVAAGPIAADAEGSSMALDSSVRTEAHAVVSADASVLRSGRPRGWASGHEGLGRRRGVSAKATRSKQSADEQPASGA